MRKKAQDQGGARTVVTKIRAVRFCKKAYDGEGLA